MSMISTPTCVQQRLQARPVAIHLIFYLIASPGSPVTLVFMPVHSLIVRKKLFRAWDYSRVPKSGLPSGNAFANGRGSRLSFESRS
jgi:hypothetical protein